MVANTYIGISKKMVEPVARTMTEMAKDKTFEEAQWFCSENKGKRLYLRIKNLADSILLSYEEREK